MFAYKLYLLHVNIKFMYSVLKVYLYNMYM